MPNIPPFRKSLALIDDDHKHIEEALLNTEILDKEAVRRILESNTGDWLTITDYTTRVLKWLEVEEKYIRQHVQYLETNARVADKRAKMIRHALADSMFYRNERHLKFAATGVSISVKELDDEITVEDDTLVPEQFIKTIPEHKEVDLAAYKEYYKRTGEIVAGFKIERNRRTVVIR